MGRAALLALLLCGAHAAHSAEPARGVFADPASITLEDYLPVTAEGFDNAVPRPADVLGHEIGTRYARHDLVVAWFRALAAASPRVEVVDLGVTHEGRPQITAIISSSGNVRNLNRLQERHMDGSPEAPLFTWHGYSVHGNEASGTQAAMAVAWYLAASRDPAVTELLRSAVIMIDPSLESRRLRPFLRLGQPDRRPRAQRRSAASQSGRALARRAHQPLLF